MALDGIPQSVVPLSPQSSGLLTPDSPPANIPGDSFSRNAYPFQRPDQPQLPFPLPPIVRVPRDEIARFCSGRPAENLEQAKAMAESGWRNRRFVESFFILMARREEAEKDQDALCILGLAAESLGWYQRALDCYTKARTLLPTEPHLWLYSGDALTNLGKHEAAVECYAEAVALDDDCENAHEGLVLALLKCDRPADALKEANDALTKYPQCITLWYAVAAANRDLKKFAQADEAVKVALSIDPYHMLSRDLICQLALDMDNLEDAFVIAQETARMH